MRKNLKKVLMVGTLLLALSMMTSCSGGKDESSNETANTNLSTEKAEETTLPIDAYSTQMETIQGTEKEQFESVTKATESKSEEDATTAQKEISKNHDNNSSNSGGNSSGSSGNLTYTSEGRRLVPDVAETHDSKTSLHIVKINGVDIDITNIKADELQDAIQSEFEQQDKYTIMSNTTDDFYFVGRGFMNNINGREYEPVVHVEMLHNGALLEMGCQKTLFNEYEVKGIAFTLNDSDEYYNHVEFYGGVKINMFKKDIEDILGKGIESESSKEHIVYYRTPQATMAIIYKDFDYVVVQDDGSETAKMADTIVLLKND